jgi:hypothetical protein
MNLRNAVIFTISLIWISCGGEQKEDDTTDVTDTVTEELDTASGELNEIAEFKFHIFVGNIPSPLETMVKLPASGITFNKDLVIPVDNVSKYKTLAEKAVAYGMYGSDLGYVTVYDQSDMVSDYFTNTHELADGIGAGDNFNRLLSERFTKNIHNRDSLLVLMDKAIGESEDYMKNNQRLELASLMMVGSWLESQYILLNSLKGKDTTSAGDLFEKIPQQKNHLKSLIDILNEQKTNADALAMAKTLAPLATEYGKITSAVVDQATLAKLLDAVTAVRKKLAK